MKLVSNETSLVISGAWNPAILTPAWVLHHGLGRPLDEGELVKAFLPAGASGLFEFPHYVHKELSFSVRPDRLILSLSEFKPEGIDILEDAAAKMIGELKHTPITGVGHNFEFRETNPKPENLNIFTASRQDLTDSMPVGWSPSSAVLAASFKNDTDTVVVNVTRQYEANTLIVKFNFHHPIKSADEAIAALKGENGYLRMRQNLILANDLMATLYGDIEND